MTIEISVSFVIGYFGIRQTFQNPSISKSMTYLTGQAVADA